jgi:hypothetical protein
MPILEPEIGGSELLGYFLKLTPVLDVSYSLLCIIYLPVINKKERRKFEKRISKFFNM